MDFRPFSDFKRLFSGVSGGPVWRGGPGDIVATLYEDGIIIDVSPSGGEVIGAAGNLVGRSIFDFVAREDRKMVRDALNHAAEKGAYADPSRLRANFRLLRVRRAPANAEIVLKPIGRGRVMTLIRDRGRELADRRTARVAEEASVPVSADLNVDLNGDLDADRRADLSHEMKTPINAIMGFADAMRSETFGPLGDAKYKEYANHIHASGKHMMTLIGAALDNARAENSSPDLCPQMNAPGPIVRECAEMVRLNAEKAGLDLNIEIAPNLPDAMIDPRVVKQILINLLSNAIKFTADGSVKLSVSEKCGALDFIVEDTGIGMNQVVLSKLGGRFSDTHQDGVRGADGSGLGLSLSFELAKRHGGILKLSSMPGEGTTARLTLPLRKGATPPQSGYGDIQSQLDRVAAYRRERRVDAA